MKEENTENIHSPFSKKCKTETRVKKVASKISKEKMFRSSLPNSNNDNGSKQSSTKKEPKIATNASALGSMYPRQILGEATFPGVDSTLVTYSLTGSSSNLTGIISLTKLSPQSLLQKIKKEWSPSQNAKSLTGVSQIPVYGNCNKGGIES